MITVTASGKVWGCPLFYEYSLRHPNFADLNKYFYGELQTLNPLARETIVGISNNYAELRMDAFQTDSGECFLCPDIGYCTVCPVIKSLANVPLTKIPHHVCEIQKILISERKRFAVQTGVINGC